MFPAVSGWCHATRPPPLAVPSQPTLLLYVLNFNERKQDTEIHIYFYLKIKIKIKIKPHRGQKSSSQHPIGVIIACKDMMG